MSKTMPKKKRFPPVPWRIPVGREEEFFALVDKAKLSANAFLTFMVFGDKPLRQSRRATLGEKLAGKILGFMGQIKQELKAIRGELLRSEDINPLLEEILTLMKRIDKRLLDIRWALFKILGRKP